MYEQLEEGDMFASEMESLFVRRKICFMLESIALCNIKFFECVSLNVPHKTRFV